MGRNMLSGALGFFQFVHGTQEPQPVRVRNIQLTPAGNVTASLAAEQQSDAEVQPFEEAGAAKNILGDYQAGPVLLGANLFEPADSLIVHGENLPAEQPFERHFPWRHLFGGS